MYEEWYDEEEQRILTDAEVRQWMKERYTRYFQGQGETGVGQWLEEQFTEWVDREYSASQILLDIDSGENPTWFDKMMEYIDSECLLEDMGEVWNEDLGLERVPDELDLFRWGAFLSVEGVPDNDGYLITARYNYYGEVWLVEAELTAEQYAELKAQADAEDEGDIDWERVVRREDVLRGVSRREA